MLKATESGRDPWLALLDWRNTPSEQLGKSPAQLMFGRRTGTRLPTADVLLSTPTAAAAQTALTAAKERQASYYDRGARVRPILPVGQTVRVRYDENDWRKAEIARVLPHRSYEVRFGDGSVRRRTSRHVRFSSEPPIIIRNHSSDADDSTAAIAPTQPIAPIDTGQQNTCTQQRKQKQSATKPVVIQSAPPVTVTRSGRVVKIPDKLRD